jgi:hypothetical protein
MVNPALGSAWKHYKAVDIFENACTKTGCKVNTIVMKTITVLSKNTK